MRHLLAHPETHDALIRWSGRALDEGRADAAIAILKEVLASKETIDGLLHLAVAYRATGEFEKAIAAIDRVISAFPEDIPGAAYHVLGITEACAGRLDRAVQALAKCVAMDPQITVATYHLASCLAFTRRFAEANKALRTESPIMCGDGKYTSTKIIKLPDSGHADSAQHSLELPFARIVTINYDRRHKEFEAVYFVCCDSRYFELFADSLANSISRNSGVRFLLHVHVINPENKLTASLDALRNRPDVAVSITTEQVELDHLAEDSRRTYFACARYFILPDLLKNYDRPIIIADIDQLVVKDLSAFLKTARDSDVSLIHFSQQSFNLLSLVSASVMVANNTPLAASFCQAVRNYLAERMSDCAAMLWHLDQAALAVIYLTMSSVRYNLLAPEIMVAAPNKGIDRSKAAALFWTITYSNPQNAVKLRSAEFRNFTNSDSSSPVHPS